MKKQKNRDMHNGLIKLMKKIQEELGDDGIGLPRGCNLNCVKACS